MRLCGCTPVWSVFHNETLKESYDWLNMVGPKVGEKDVAALCQTLDSLGNGDFLVLSGNVSQYIRGAYATMMKHISGKPVRVIVDTSGKELLETLAFHPFLIKPNLEEFELILQTQVKSYQDLLDGVHSLQKIGAENILLSMGEQGAILFTGEGAVYQANPIRGTARNSVGAGDSMVAGC